MTEEQDREQMAYDRGYAQAEREIVAWLLQRRPFEDLVKASLGLRLWGAWVTFLKPRSPFVVGAQWVTAAIAEGRHRHPLEGASHGK